MMTTKKTETLNTEAEDLFQLCKAAHVTVGEDGNIRMPKSMPAKLVEAVKERKSAIVEAMSGYCFSRDVFMGRDHLGKWKIMKASNIASVYYHPVEIVSGGAIEVDAWAKANSNDPFFSNDYTSKYYYARVAEPESSLQKGTAKQ